ncbi:MAG: hypothetical protein ABGW69_03285 [Nanoarchaeota archaeon]
MFFLEGLEIELIRPVKKKIYVILEDEEFIYYKETNNEKEKIEGKLIKEKQIEGIKKIKKENLIIKLKLNNRIIYINEDQLKGKVSLRTKKLKKLIKNRVF